MQERNRIYLFDNVKAMLIFLVVLGHMLEIIVSRRGELLYSFIYLFHMPLFVFCSGYFANFRPKRFFFNYAGLYVLFQLFYILFARFALGVHWMPIQFSTPYWIMWYLMALIAWTLILPLLDAVTIDKPAAIIAICASFALGIAAGFDSMIGYYLSLSRIVYFFPFFVLGFCIRKHFDPDKMNAWLKNNIVRCFSGAVTIAIAVWIFTGNPINDPRWLWGSSSYEHLAYTGYNVVVRILLYAAALFISVFCIAVLPKRKLFFTTIGTRTLQVFLFHGFIIQLLRHNNIIYHLPWGIITWAFVFLVSIVTVLVFSSWLFAPSAWYKIFAKKR